MMRPFISSLGSANHRDRAFGDEFAGQPLDRDRDDALGAPVGFLARLLFDHPDLAGGVMARLPDHLFDHLAPASSRVSPATASSLARAAVDHFLVLGL